MHFSLISFENYKVIRKLTDNTNIKVTMKSNEEGFCNIALESRGQRENRILEMEVRMRVDAYNQISQIYTRNNIYKAKKEQKTADRDQFHMSDDARIYQYAKNAVGEVPDIREAKAEELKQKIQNGTYQVSPESFANKMLEMWGR